MQAMESLDLIKDVCRFMQNNLQYCSPEQRAYSRANGCWWKTPEETLKDGFGFCYDLSAFALHSLEKAGLVKSKLLFVAWGHWGAESNAGHFVCIYKIGDSFYSIDNGILKGPFSFNQLFLSASRGREIHSYRYFTSDQIPYHTTYENMAEFLGS